MDAPQPPQPPMPAARQRRKGGRRRFGRTKAQERISEINMTPLIDLAFALLIIFMIAAPMMEQSIRIDLPEQSSDPTPAPQDLEIRTISIDKEGTYYWDKQPVDLTTLKTHIQGVAGQPDPPALSIRADANIKYQKVLDVIDYVKDQKLTKISLGTRQD